MRRAWLLPLERRLRRFARDASGVSAVEFTLLMPFILAMYFGGVEVTNLVAADRKNAQATRTLSDLVSQMSSCQSNTAPTNVADVFRAARAVIAPFPDTNLSSVVSCISISTTGTAKVMWSNAYQATARTVNSTFTAPTGLADTTQTTYWVIGESSYNYIPVVGYMLTGGTYVVSNTSYMRSRANSGT